MLRILKEIVKLVKRLVLWLISFIIGLGVMNMVNRVLCIKLWHKAKAYAPVLNDDVAKFACGGDGDYVFTMPKERDFKILQLTDIHLGGGWLSYAKDKKALAKVAELVHAQSPDLVVVTGDMIYPVFVQSASLKNLRQFKIFCRLMASLAVPWTFVFGNHDTENYCVHERADLARWIMRKRDRKAEYANCVFADNSGKGVAGVGNQLIKLVSDKDGLVVRNLLLLDSHSYLKSNPFGLVWEYDNIKDSQVEWAVEKLNEVKADNDGIMPSTMLFTHIPIYEYRTAWSEYALNDYADTQDAQYILGSVGEKQDKVDSKGNKVWGVYTSLEKSALFDRLCKLDGTLTHAFCGHDHKNDLAMRYKGVELVYGKSIDYLAYPGIARTELYRGGLVICCNELNTTYKHC